MNKEMLEDIYLPGKKELTTKLLSWVDQGLLNPRELLRICLGYMSEDDIDDVVALVESDFEEDEDVDDDLYIAAKLEEAFEAFDQAHPNKSVPQQAEPVPRTFNGFIF